MADTASQDDDYTDVRAIIHSCLKNGALRWYTHELSKTEKRLLQCVSLDDGWFESLKDRFKPNRANALHQLAVLRYTRQDVRDGYTLPGWAQTMLRLL